MMRLLVSVRSVHEALVAARGGADFIDCKEPARGALGDLPMADVRAIVERLRDAGMQQREDIRKLTESGVGDLQAKGRAIHRPTADSVRAKLRESGFYGEWKGRFGPEAWALLEGAVGKLA